MEKKTHSLCLLHATCVHGMAAEGSYLSCQLRESKLHNERKNKLIENCSSEKKLILGRGYSKTTDELIITGSEWHCWGVEEWQGCGEAATENVAYH